MTRRRPPLLLAALAGLLLAGCGSSSGGVARATAPPLPDTTAPPTPTPSASASPTAQPSPTPSATPAPTPTLAEGNVERVSPDDPQGGVSVAADLYPSSGSENCASRGPVGYGACPVTSRLAEQLNGLPASGRAKLCRCQNTWQGVTIKTPAALPVLDTYTVEVDLDVYGTSIRFDLTVLHRPDGWFADDIRCHGGDSSTSIYASSPPNCG